LKKFVEFKFVKGTSEGGIGAEQLQNRLVYTCCAKTSSIRAPKAANLRGFVMARRRGGTWCGRILGKPFHTHTSTFKVLATCEGVPGAVLIPQSKTEVPVSFTAGLSLV
jgi:hypothetical protein